MISIIQVSLVVNPQVTVQCWGVGEGEEKKVERGHCCVGVEQREREERRKQNKKKRRRRRRKDSKRREEEEEEENKQSVVALMSWASSSAAFSTGKMAPALLNQPSPAPRSSSYMMVN